jgi:hypothetical protein
MRLHLSAGVTFGPSRETSTVLKYINMFGGGFGGTPREDEWRRRKEKEYQQESAIYGCARRTALEEHS